MDIRPIRTDEDHRAALAGIEACWGAPEGTEEGDTLDVLLALVDIYKAKRWPIEIDETFDPVDVLRYAIDELGHTEAELAELLGSRSRASEVLARRRALTVEMIHKIGAGGEFRPTFWFVLTRLSEPPDPLDGGNWSVEDASGYDPLADGRLGLHVCCLNGAP
jgi:HTH-type transcriptional regulator / antitoxin HigA